MSEPRYKIVSGTIPEVERIVHISFERGWKLFGSPFSDSHEDGTVICQAMIRDEKKSELNT